MSLKLKQMFSNFIYKLRVGLKGLGVRLGNFFNRFSRRKPDNELTEPIAQEPELALDDTGTYVIRKGGQTLNVRRVGFASEAPQGETISFKPINATAVVKTKTDIYKPEKTKRHPGIKDEAESMFTERAKMRPFLLSVMFTTIKVLFSLLVVFGLGCLGLGLGIFRAYIETTPELDTSRLTDSDLTSYIYDKNGDLITTFAGMEYRDWVNFEDIPDMLKNAVIAIEDVRFYKHEGVDYKRLFSAIVNTFRNTNTHGGSTITQQLIKNNILSDEQTYKRKIREAYLALELEDMLDKDSIIEAYLNDVFLGESNYGVKAAAKDYFGKELNELTIRECAMLAGCIQKPYTFNPRKNMYQRDSMDLTNERTDTVLDRMYSAGFITYEQYQHALKDTVHIVEVSQKKQLYDMPYFVEYAVRDVITHMLKQRGLLDTTANRSAIENELRTGGYKIYTTVDPDIQNAVQDTLANWENYPTLADPSAGVKITTNTDGSTMEVVQPQAAAVVLDYRTGELRAVVGGRNTPTMKKEWNRAYQSSLPVGSSIKPIAVYGPALDLGASPGSVIYNIPGAIKGYGGKGYPNLGDEDFLGPVTMRTGVVESLNIVAARTLFEKVTLQTSFDYLVNLGIDSSRINMDGPGLALGTSGITPIEMAGAYGTIATGGTYYEPLSFTKVVDARGNVVLDANEIRDTHQVFKTSTAYMLVDMLTNAVKSGTGIRAKIDGVTVAGKTGTNADYGSVYFAGMTPYYVATVWIGHDDYAQKLKSGSTGGRYAAPLWQAFMSKIHEGLSDKPIIDASPEELGLIKVKVCTVSGLLATEACEHDNSGHLPVSEYYLTGTEPAEQCNMHVLTNVCNQSNQQASEYCPSASTAGVVLINSESPYRQFETETLLKAIPNAVLTDIDISLYGKFAYEPSQLCKLHTPGWVLSQQSDVHQTVTAPANALLAEVNSFLNMNYWSLSADQRSLLAQGITLLNNALATGDTVQAAEQMQALQKMFEEVKSALPQNPEPSETNGGGFSTDGFVDNTFGNE